MIIGYMTFNLLEAALDTAGTKFKYFEFSKGNFFNTLGPTGEELTCKYCPVAKGEMFPPPKRSLQNLPRSPT